MLTFHWDQHGMRQTLMKRNARVDLAEAMPFEDAAAVEKMLRRGKSALPKIQPNDRPIGRGHDGGRRFRAP